MAMQDSCSMIISLFQALGLFLYKNPLVARPFFSIVPTDRERTQKKANKPSQQKPTNKAAVRLRPSSDAVPLSRRTKLRN